MLEDSTVRIWTLIIAVYGVAQVWLIALWKKFFQKGNLSIYRSGTIELGHADVGPTIAIDGTLLAEKRDVFVSQILLNATRLKDNATHEFSWGYFRSPIISLGTNKTITLEIPAGFIVKQDSPHRYNIFFIDQNEREDLLPHLVSFKEEWVKFYRENNKKLKEVCLENNMTEAVALQMLYEKGFSNQKIHQKIWDVIRSKVFFTPGEYRIEMKIMDGKNIAIASDEWNFKVNTREYENLRLNAIAVPRELCLGFGSVQYNFAIVNCK